MKLIMILTIALSSTIVMANDFELIKDGTTYSCTPKSSPNPVAVVACVSAAQGNTGGWLSKDQAVKVCQGAKNNSPALCAGAAQGNTGAARRALVCARRPFSRRGAALRRNSLQIRRGRPRWRGAAAFGRKIG